jgi:dTDP-4-dehydrorhamnose reductase
VAPASRALWRWKTIGYWIMILVFGKTGQVAKELQCFDDVIALDRRDADLSNPQSCANAILKHMPKAVINAAAYTAVDKAEEEECLANVINGDAPTAMAEACAELGVPLVHISTDYVFEGTGERPWCPNDTTAPQNAYGRSKLLGEIGIRNSGATHTILRTSWVFSAHGNNFVKTMLQFSETREALTIVSDQIGGPTPARGIASACLRITEQLIKDPSKSGTYHFSGIQDVSWATFADEIFKQTGRSVTVTPILTKSYPTRANRPLNSRMDCRTTELTFGIKRCEWRRDLNEVLKDLEVNI